MDANCCWTILRFYLLVQSGVLCLLWPRHHLSSSMSTSSSRMLIPIALSICWYKVEQIFKAPHHSDCNSILNPLDFSLVLAKHFIYDLSPITCFMIPLHWKHFKSVSSFCLAKCKTVIQTSSWSKLILNTQCYVIILPEMPSFVISPLQNLIQSSNL